MKTVVTQQEYQDWLEAGVTRAFFKTLEANREELKENIVMGLYDEKQELEVKGICKSVINILDMSYEQLMEGYANAK